MKQQQLNQIADRLEATLAQHKIYARVVGGRSNDFGLSMVLQPANGINPDKVFAARNIIKLAMRSDKINIAQHGALIEVLAVSGYSGNAVYLSDLIGQYGQLGQYHAVCGLRDDGQALAINLASPQTPHAMISGTTGSGKTVLAQSIITSLTHLNRPHTLGIVVLDPKGGDELFLNNISHHLLMPVATTPDEQFLALEKVVQTMLERGNGNAMPRIVVYCDELADTALAGGKAALDLLSRIAARGRSAGINIIGCTQNPSSKSLPEDLRRNLPLRIVGKVSNPTEAKMAIGIANSGAELLAGRGSFICTINGVIQRFQGALPDLDISNPCKLPEWPKRGAYSHDAPVAMPHAKPLQISAPVMSQPVINPVANNVSMSSDITIQTVISAMLKLKTDGKPVNRSTVLTTMNKPAGGAHWRQLTALWDTATAQFQAI
jgi:S-DNA-T family DNA segregation ATPase FtsK/SpoIIIE